ncbi:NfeD family protein [Promicromonospora thailandica]|uniref:Membrane protein implicated in regulation of membrane protease activity n=1 Tax=Promicromonospora thailandica TaxID=765201 RepID=A0A9X2G3Y7_9MICO|nr:NfeD family protein [Promicromonospora thailandica]MCP2265078.1 Membrane protein implicated in regulation of membrane protease activity [Promicromonospora thailandica]
MLVFIVIGLLGLALAVTSLLLGDFFELADGAVSGTSLGAGALLFGATGTVVLSSGLDLWVAYPAGAVVAVLVIVLVNVLISRLKAGEDGGPVSLVGAQGSVTSDVDTAHGEVSLDAATELETRLAFADEPIPQGTRVVVVEQHGARVKVEPVPR